MLHNKMIDFEIIFFKFKNKDLQNIINTISVIYFIPATNTSSSGLSRIDIVATCEIPLKKSV